MVVAGAVSVGVAGAGAGVIEGAVAAGSFAESNPWECLELGPEDYKPTQREAISKSNE